MVDGWQGEMEMGDLLWRRLSGVTKRRRYPNMSHFMFDVTKDIQSDMGGNAKPYFHTLALTYAVFYVCLLRH